MAAVTGADVEYIPSASGPSAAGGPALVNIAARPGWRVVIGYLLISYSAAPVGGRVIVSDGGGSEVDLDVAAAGVTTVLQPDAATRFNPSQPVTVTLAAGGGAVVAKITCGYRYIRTEG